LKKGVLPNVRPILKRIFQCIPSAYFSAFANLGNEGVTAREISDDEVEEGSAKQYWPVFHKEGGFDMIERAVLAQLAQNFVFHWDIEFTSSTAPNGTVRTGQGSGRSGTEIKFINVLKAFEHNTLITNPQYQIMGDRFTVPPNSTIKTELKGEIPFSTRTIIIDTKLATLKIEIIPSGAGIAPSGVWGLAAPSPSLTALGYDIKLNIEYERALNTKELDAYKRWFHAVSDVLEQLDWSRIDRDVEKALMRKMLVQPVTIAQ
jgi:hypothetical protein